MMLKDSNTATMLTAALFIGLFLSVCAGDDAEALLPVAIKGNGGMAFRVCDPRWREKVSGFVSAAPAFRGAQSGAEQLWIVTWQGSRVYYYATDGVNQMVPSRPDGESGLAIIAAEDSKADVLGVPLEHAEPGVLLELKVFDRALSQYDVLAAGRAWRKASLSLDSHFGTADRPKKLTVTVSSGRVRDLSGAQLELADDQGHLIESPRVIRANGQTETYDVRLPFGEYRIRLTKGRELLAEDRYAVLSEGCAYELKGVDGAGRPRHMELVRTILPDPARLGADSYRSVGDTHFGELDGTRYLETGERQWDRFAIRFAVDTNAPLHCLELDYPDDRKRTMDILVQDTWYGRNPANWTASDYTLAVGIATGGEEYRNQNRILTHRCLFWTGSGEDVTLVVSALKDHAPAAISEIRLYKVTDGALPAAAINEPPANDRGVRRMIGQFWEDPAVLRDFRVAHGTLRDLDTLIDRHVAQMKYSGQNLLAYPGAWYKGLVGQDGYTVRGHRAHYLEAYYEKFDRAGLCLMPTVEVLNVPERLERFDAGSLKDGSLHGTSFAIRSNGEAVPGWHGSPPNHNVAHPNVQSEIERIVAALADEGKDHPSFKGVTLFLPMDVCLWWGSIESGYNDYCIESFEKTTGIRVPVDRTDPLRGKRYAEWLRANAYEKWVQWRCDVVTEFYARLAKVLSDRRADLRLRLDIEPPVDVTRNLSANSDYYTDAMRPRLMREAGIDEPALRRRIPNLVFGTIVYNVRQRKRDYWMKDPKVRERYIRLPETASWWAETVASAFPNVVIRDDFWESDIGAKATGERALNCAWFKEIGWRVSAVLPSARNVMKYYALPLRYGDIMGVSHGGFLICDYGMEEAEVAFAKAFRALPAVKMSDVKSQDEGMTDVRVRHCVYSGKSYFYIVNTGEKPTRISVLMPPSTVDLASGRSVSGKTAIRMDMELEAYDLRSFAAPAGCPDWTLGPADFNMVN